MEIVMKSLFARFIREDEGQDLIEYAFLAVFIALAVIVAIKGVATNLNTQFSNIGTQVGGGS
jgi:pilus assembly protein Flp/PilA